MAELSDAAWIRLKKYAAWRIRGVPALKRERRDARELLDSSLEATFDETRRWNKGQDIVKHLEDVMSSQASHWTKKTAPDTSILAADLVTGGGKSRDPMAETAAAVPSAEREAIAKNLLERVEALFADDAEAAVVLGGLRDQLTTAEIAEILDVEEVAVETIKKRIYRRARAAFPEGKSL